MSNGRGEHGHFARGNKGGPGRPRRAIEREYLAAISDACPPEVWREVVERAVADAKAGDAKARDWLARHLLGETRAMTLLELAANEAGGRTPDDEVAGLAENVQRDARLREYARGISRLP